MNNFLNSSITYGLAGMFGYGLINFLIASVSRRLGAFRAAFLIRIFPFLITLALLPFFKADLKSPGFFLLLAIPGLLSTLGSVSFTNGLAVGAVAIISPIVSVWALVTAVLSFLFLHEPLTLPKGIGILLTIIGITLVSANFKEIITTKKIKILAGVKWACLTAVIWGTTNFLLALLGHHLGWYSTNFGVRFWSVIGFISLLALRRQPILPLFTKFPKIIYFLSLADVIFFFIFNRGLSLGQPAVVSAVTAASPLVSSLLANRYLGETTSREQKIGIILVTLGLICLTFS